MQAFQLISDQVLQAITRLGQTATAAAVAASDSTAMGIRQDSRKWGVQPGPDYVGPRYGSVLSALATNCHGWTELVPSLRSAVEQAQQVLEETNGDQAAALRRIQDLLGTGMAPAEAVAVPAPTGSPATGGSTGSPSGLGYQTGGR